MAGHADAFWWSAFVAGIAAVVGAGLLTRRRADIEGSGPWRLLNLRNYPAAAARGRLLVAGLLTLGAVLLFGTRGPSGTMGLLLLNTIGALGTAQALRGGRLGSAIARKAPTRKDAPVMYWAQLAAGVLVILAFDVRALRQLLSR